MPVLPEVALDHRLAGFQGPGALGILDDGDARRS
jgi:hypothetical protein